MGARHSTPPPSDTATDKRTLLERWLDPSNVMNATTTHPQLMHHLNNPPSPEQRSSSSEPHISLSIVDDSDLHSIDLQHSPPPPSPSPPSPQALPQHPHRPNATATDDSYVDAALSLVAPPAVRAMLATHRQRVSGEMQFAIDAAKKDRRRSGSSADAGLRRHKQSV